MRRSAVLIVALVAFGATGCSFLRPAPAAGTHACVNVPQEICDEIIAGRVNNRAPVALTGFQVVCKSSSCANGGEAEVDMAWADGKSETFSYTWTAPIEGQPEPLSS